MPFRVRLMQTGNHTGILPSLKYFFSTSYRPKLHVFVAPSLQAVFVDFPAHEKSGGNIEKFLATLSQKSPQISYLKLSCSISEACLQAIVRMSCLKHLSVCHTVENHLVAGIDPSFFENFRRIQRFLDFI
ncbi:hypothetical protein CPB84DRAFT_254009 [Gymnopilus junonius]|uniref:Uncharacterized protein n=1 Tax=Gymnopilus junonius TaxID=109634 RepID=A0A9P5NEU2_GYMJU|nr:hypothetical protein CPB84DRAFT_254009 [Gymnopilus junonius]